MSKADNWLSKTLDYRFNDAGYFQQSLTHRSAQGGSNERLEYLGDAVLDLVVSEALYRARPEADEGDLSRLRASIVRDKSLAELAGALGLGEHLVLGSGEKKAGGHRRESILADALEALIGAVYLDSDFDTAERFVKAALGDRLTKIPDAEDLRDPKTRLQEWLQARGDGLPEYELLNVSGKAHKQRFEVSCTVPGQAATTGTGTSRREAEQESAERMLQQLGAHHG